MVFADRGAPFRMHRTQFQAGISSRLIPMPKTVYGPSPQALQRLATGCVIGRNQ